MGKKIISENTDSVNAANSGIYNQGGFRLIDILVVIIFLSIAAFSVNLFLKDLMQTINLRNVEPVGVVVIRKNIVQRRLVDRVIWDRLSAESPVYLGDLIRVADLSSATLFIDGNSIDLNENTLIRLSRAPDGASLQIMMDEGTISVAATPESGRLSLDIGGRQIQMVTPDPVSGTAAEGGRTVLNITSAQDGITLQVNEGAAQFIEEGQVREINAGNQLSLDAAGTVREERSVVVINPVNNAHFINDSRNPLPVYFLWNRINLESDELLRLEIASDRNFNRIVHTRNNLNSEAQTNLANGLWYWRLSYDRTVLRDGQFRIVNGTGPRLQSPAASSIFRFTDELPVLRFEWAEVEDASSYIIEISDNEGFTTTQVQRQSQAVFFTESSLADGTWYWRVKPVFPPVYSGSASFSQVSRFSIERTIIEQAAPELSLEEWYIAALPPEKPALPELYLTSPAQRADIEGLTALRQQVVFTWECDTEIISSRFVLSRNVNPFQGRPYTEIQNPDSIISVSNLAAGTWYWNIEAQTISGNTVRASVHGIFQVLPIPLLPPAQNLRPASGHSFTMSDLQARRNISFSWDAVEGANTYILTIYQQAGGRRWQTFQTPMLTRTGYLLEDLRFLDRGTFIWHVEAINRGQGGIIEQRGTQAESSFTLEIILPGRIQLDGANVMQGR